MAPIGRLSDLTTAPGPGARCHDTIAPLLGAGPQLLSSFTSRRDTYRHHAPSTSPLRPGHTAPHFLGFFLMRFLSSLPSLPFSSFFLSSLSSPLVFLSFFAFFSHSYRCCLSPCFLASF